MRTIAILVLVAFLVSIGADAGAVPVTSLPAAGESNAGLVEYVLLVAIIAGVAITGMKLLGSNTNQKLNNAGSRINNTGGFQAAPLTEASQSDTALPPDIGAMTSGSITDPDSGATAASALTVTNSPVALFTPRVNSRASVSRPVTRPDVGGSAGGQATGNWDLNAETAGLMAQVDFSNPSGNPIVSFTPEALPGDSVRMGLTFSRDGVPFYDWGFRAAIDAVTGDLRVIERRPQFSDGDLTFSGRSITAIESQLVPLDFPVGVTSLLAVDSQFAVDEPPIPEPGTLLLLATGLGALGAGVLRRRARRQSGSLEVPGARGRR